KLSVWRPRRSGTSSGSEMVAKEMRREAVRFATASADGAEGVREAAKRGPSLRNVCTRAGQWPTLAISPMATDRAPDGARIGVPAGRDQEGRHKPAQSA